MRFRPTLERLPDRVLPSGLDPAAVPLAPPYLVGGDGQMSLLPPLPAAPALPSPPLNMPALGDGLVGGVSGRVGDGPLPAPYSQLVLPPRQPFRMVLDGPAVNLGPTVPLAPPYLLVPGGLTPLPSK